MNTDMGTRRWNVPKRRLPRTTLEQRVDAAIRNAERTLTSLRDIKREVSGR